LGVLAYVLLTGYFPFDFTDPKTIPLLVRTGAFNRSRVSRLSPAAQQFIFRLLRVNPTERPNAIDIVRNDPWLTDKTGTRPLATKASLRTEMRS